MLVRERRMPHAYRPMPNLRMLGRNPRAHRGYEERTAQRSVLPSRYVRRNVNRLFVVSHRRNRTSW